MKNWEDVKQDILSIAFSLQDAEAVRLSKNLEKEGIMDSLSIVVILELLSDGNPGIDYMDFASASDFRSLDTIKALYERITK